ncbi:hypothetical protein [Stenotrophomonas sp. CFBP 13725]|uniref:hypothetical protein n=1 Tax=Stenotrophomonas sp. CFBP 13725 TaxID=2775297 RepID=UPI001781AAE2|nr:hypothetical protein [Stenotrophomonas sp. CFBP 13725]MBD8635539.1 hypothetical protein [Stenotrophomonas sp. CFBP 13725]
MADYVGRLNKILQDGVYWGRDMKLAILSLALAAFAFAVGLLFMYSHAGVDDKSIYADIQSAEVNGRGMVGTVLYRTSNGRRVAGVETREGSRVWIYLGGVGKGGGLLSVPDIRRFVVECRLIRELMLSHPVHPTVASALKNSCVE